MPGATIVYFTRVDLSRVDNGGGLVCRNHARRIAQTDGIDLTVCCIGPQDQVDRAADFVASIGARFEPIPFAGWVAPSAPRAGKMMLEAEALSQPHIDPAFSEILDRLRPDALVVDYLYSAMYIPSAYRRRGLRRIIVTLNREVEYV